MSIWIWVLLVSVTAILGYAFLYLKRIGYFVSLGAHEIVVSGGHCLYVDFQGDYQNVSNLFTQIMPDCNIFFRNLKCVDSIGFFYDSPAATLEPNKCRAVAGILIPPSVDKAKEIDPLIAKSQTKFEYRWLPQASAYEIRFPHHSLLGFKLMVQKVYGALCNQLLEKGVIGNVGEIQGKSTFMEVYNWCGPNRNTEVRFITGDNAKHYLITKYPPPKYPEGEPEKKDQ